MVIRTDQEPAVNAANVKLRRAGETMTIPELAPVGDSKANGLAEKGVQEVTGQGQVLKFAPESHLQRKFPIEHVMIPWLIMWAAASLNYFGVGIHGKKRHTRD